ncbi:pirin family protein [Spirilliplanes yamanashiensis]|uniref:Pirin n=1 Tax=Spirilliplanes yamanashiensis TaxID=42233 RepID=A0A8J4DK31_9ACTN|nr:pirin family protein [Spirilliplanes yamanashiensis]MDP9818003.1 redox-sensitive bicupin YhaK (pirin superfamily) [Spirilliplanes yamanashiensis]GIJ04812.1 hypothetical protein Sya03_41640 [Spirilliplanes yamanashiensis]
MDDTDAPGGPELLPGHEVALGGPRGMTVRRTLPDRGRRMVGAWCFLDAYGPQPIAPGAPGMRIGPHPHIGLQTVSWLLRGEILHRDSVGSLRQVEPGQLNLMTAGRGIAHSEETPAAHSGVLHGVQLWVALPDGARHTDPAFAHHPDLPVLAADGLSTTVIMGELDGAASPAATHSPLVGAELRLTAGGAGTLPLRPGFEYALLVVDGPGARVDGHELTAGPLLYLGAGRTALRVAADGPATLVLIGGEPFDERIVMWWNFVGRDHDEIVAARADWAAGARFGAVHGYAGPPLPAPAMPATRLAPRGRVRDLPPWS